MSKTVKKVGLEKRPHLPGDRKWVGPSGDSPARFELGTDRPHMPNYVEYYYDDPAIWEPNEKFTGKLSFVRWERGRSRTTFWFKDESGKEWPFFATDIARMLEGLVIEGTFQAVKRGANYGLTFVDPE